MAAPVRIDELTASGSLSAGAAIAIVQSGGTFRTTPRAFITEAESFTQSGTAPTHGFSSRSVAARLRDLVNITDFKNSDGSTVTGDGTTDNTTGIQSALDWVHSQQKGGIFFPPGTYLTGEIDWPGNSIALVGAGSGYAYNTSATPRTILKAKAGTTNVLDLVQTGLAEDRTNNLLANFQIDGNSIATNGIKVAGANLLHGVTVKGCTNGVLLENFTNSTHIVECGLNSNSAYGLKAQGVSATTFSITRSQLKLNTSGGARLETGFGVSFENCVFESNDGPGLSIYAPDAHTNNFGNFWFRTCWWEDNGTGAAISIDAETRNAANAPIRIRFENCHASVSDNAYDYVDLLCARKVEFHHCHFDNSTQSDAINVNATAFEIGFRECSGLTTAQIDAAIAAGTRVYFQETDAVTVDIHSSILKELIGGQVKRQLTAAGYTKCTNDGTFNGATGAYHEFRTTDSGQPIILASNKHASTPNGLYTYFSAAAPDNNTQYFHQYVDSSATRVIIWSDGDIQNHDNSYGAISDERLKTGIRDSGSQWDDIKNLRVRKYKFKSDGEKAVEHIGVVAQEVQKVSPGLVTHNEERDEYGVQYSVLYMKAIKALQEAMERIEKLEAAVAAK